MRAPKAGNVHKLDFRTNTVTTGATIEVRLETVDATTGLPTGTLFGTNTNNASVVIAGADDSTWFAVALTADAAVTLGDVVAIVFKNPSSSFGNMEVGAYTADSQSSSGYVVSQAAAKVTAVNPLAALEYDDGTYSYIPGVWPVETFTTVSFNNTSTPDEIGLRFSIPFPARIAGAWFWMDGDSGPFSVHLYGSDGATNLFTAVAIDNDQISQASTTGGIMFVKFSPQTLTASTNYRLVLEPTSATNISLFTFDVDTTVGAALLDAYPGGDEFHYTTAKNPAAEGDWTQTLTRRPFIGLLFDQVSNTTGGGGGSIPARVGY
jgi:hypothetical protein